MKKKYRKKLKPKFLSSRIVKQIRDNIKQREFLYQKYLEDNAISSIDPVANREFLISGWNESMIHQNEIVRTVNDKFNFILNLMDAKQLILSAALIGKESYINPIQLAIKVNGEFVGKAEIRYSHFFQYVFKIPKKLRRRNAKVQGEIHKANKNIKMGVRLISAYSESLELESIQEKTIEIQKLKKDIDHFLQVLEWHKNPEYLLPADTSSRSVKKLIKRAVLFAARPLLDNDSIIIKKIVLRLIRPFSTPQIIFNNNLTELLILQSKRIEILESLVLSRGKVSGVVEK